MSAYVPSGATARLLSTLAYGRREIIRASHQGDGQYISANLAEKDDHRRGETVSISVFRALLRDGWLERVGGHVVSTDNEGVPTLAVDEFEASEKACAALRQRDGLKPYDPAAARGEDRS